MNTKTIYGIAIIGLTVALATTTFARDNTQMGGGMMGQTNQQTNQQNHHGTTQKQNINQHHKSADGTHHADASKYLKNAPCLNSNTKGVTKVN